MIVIEGAYCYSASCVIPHAWKIGTTEVDNCNINCDTHWTSSAAGWFNGSTIAGESNNPSMLFRSWTKFGTLSPSDITELNTGNAPLGSGFDIHESNKNDPFGTHSYPILTSTYAPEIPAGSISNAYSNEVIGWPQTPGPVLRFGHTFNSSLAPSSCCFSTEFAIGGPSSTEHFYIFTTDGEGTLGSVDGSTCSLTEGNCRSDVFILNLSPPAAN